MRPVQVRVEDDGLSVDVRLQRRESVVLAIDTARGFVPSAASRFDEELWAPELEWRLFDESGDAVEGPAPGDWAQFPGLELFSGTLCYRAELDIPEEAYEAWLDLGTVGDATEVVVDGAVAGWTMWPPHRVQLGHRLRPGPHQVEVRVTNTMANAYDGAQRPSGLIGPTGLILRYERQNDGGTHESTAR